MEQIINEESLLQDIAEGYSNYYATDYQSTFSNSHKEH